MKRRFSIMFFLMITVIAQNAIAALIIIIMIMIMTFEPSLMYRGSMKKTDLLNLRIPAMKMLNGLIPDGSYAGV